MWLTWSWFYRLDWKVLKSPQPWWVINNDNSDHGNQTNLSHRKRKMGIDIYITSPRSFLKDFSTLSLFSGISFFKPQTMCFQLYNRPIDYLSFVKFGFLKTKTSHNTRLGHKVKTVKIQRNKQHFTFHETFEQQSISFNRRKVVRIRSRLQSRFTDTKFPSSTKKRWENYDIQNGQSNFLNSSVHIKWRKSIKFENHPSRHAKESFTSTHCLLFNSIQIK